MAPATVPPVSGAPQQALASVGRVTEASPATEVLGFRLESAGAAATLAPATAVPTAVLGSTIERAAGSLPRTGGEVTTLAMCGLALVAVGSALRLGGRPVRRRG